MPSIIGSVARHGRACTAACTKSALRAVKRTKSTVRAAKRNGKLTSTGLSVVVRRGHSQLRSCARRIL